MNLRYEVKVANGNGQSKVIGNFGYKQDALAVAKRFVNVTVTRKGRTNRTVYTHNHAVKPAAKAMFTLSGAKKASKGTTHSR